MSSPRALQPLSFASSGSTRTRFFGAPVEVGIHYASAKVPYTKLLCPNSLGIETKCKLCHSARASMKLMALAWDYKKKRWSAFIHNNDGFQAIFSQCKAVGASEAMLRAGTAPDFLLQVQGSTLTTLAMPETMGEPPFPTQGVDVVEYFAKTVKGSLWKKYDSVGALELKFPRTKSV